MSHTLKQELSLVDTSIRLIFTKMKKRSKEQITPEIL